MAIAEQRAARVYTELSECGGELTIRVAGNFDFNVHREFQRAYQDLSPAPQTYSIDLSETSHLDSAALGMLLLLRDHCSGAEGNVAVERVELLNANSHVAKILAVSNFDQIFTIR